MTKLIIFLLISSGVQAGVFKCSTPSGGVKFQRGPCTEGERGQPIKLLVPPKHVIDKMQIESMQRDIEASRRALERRQAEAIKRRRESNLRLQQELDEARDRRHEYYRERQAIYDQQLEQLRHDRYCRESLHISPHDECN